MKTYNVVFCFSVRVEAEDQEAAADKAWESFATANPNNYDDFALTAEEMEPEA
jgi:hypothetical protein